MEYLDFELPIKELEEQLDKCVALGNETNVDVSDTCNPDILTAPMRLTISMLCVVIPL